MEAQPARLDQPQPARRKRGREGDWSRIPSKSNVSSALACSPLLSSSLLVLSPSRLASTGYQHSSLCPAAA
ncbi:hypothetical protein Mapa_008499 [Marchantia paleacea]|nr:hypothetical protein Mapa_008499 [Marchantia paleacea]